MENTKPKEQIVDLVRKLLSLSTSPNEHEAARALEKAQEILLKYNLQMRDIEIKEEHHTLDFINLPINTPDRVQDWKLLLLHRIASPNFCKVVTAGKYRFYILGRGFNVVSVMEMFSWVQGQLEILAMVNTTTYQGRDKLRYRNSFLMGCIERIGQRLREAQKSAMQSDVQTTALVVDSRKLLEDFTLGQFPNLGHGRSLGTNNSAEGYRDGQSAGDKVSLVTPSRQVGSQGQIGGN